MDYYFRALNRYDIHNWERNKSIAVKKGNSIANMNCMRNVISHIQEGSNAKSLGCWLSASKEFKLCATEFSIPQNGDYNTADRRKKIAVIESVMNDNYTYLSGTHANGNQITMHLGGSLQVSSKVWIQQAFSVKSINTFVLDLSYPSKNNRNPKKVPLSEFSFADWETEGFILTKNGIRANGVSGVASGSCQKAKEILILNEIPVGNVKKVLSAIEIDILYIFSQIDAAANTTDFLQLISSNLNITASLKFNRKYRRLYDDLYTKNKNMHNIAFALTRKNYDILSVYSQLKKYKKELLLDIIRNINYGSINLQNNIQKIQVNDINILEDVLDIIAIDKPKNLPSIELYYGQLPIDTGSLPVGSNDDYTNFNDVVIAVNYSNNPLSQGINTNNRLTWLNKSSGEEIQRNEFIKSTKSRGCSTKRGFIKLSNVIV